MSEKKVKAVKIGDFFIGGNSPLVMIAGPCVIESRQSCLSIAKKLNEISKETKIPFVFKASYDKANRSSSDSFRGPGLIKGLEILKEIKETLGVPVLTQLEPELQVFL